MNISQGAGPLFFIVELKRIVHPVGCGAFITEEFMWAGGGFTVVYDCGMGRSPRAPKDLTSIIDNSFSASQVINLLFLSHFDNDHTNGVGYLIEKQRITTQTRVVLPLVEDRTFVLLPYYYQQGYLRVLDSLQGKSKELIFVESLDAAGENDDNNDSVQRANKELPSYVNAHFDGNCKIVKSGRIIPVVKTVNNSYWEYIPFYLQDHSVLDSFRDYLTGKSSNSKYSFSLSDLTLYQQLTDNQRQQIKEAYHTFNHGKSYRNGPNHINMNSMLLISKPKDLIVANQVDAPKQSYNKVASLSSFPVSAIFTADVGLGAKYFIDSLKEIVNKHLPDGIGLFQIPHHGSYKNYNKDIYVNLKLNVLFINGSLKSSNPAICPDSINDSYKYNKPLYIVDETSATQFEQYIQI